MAGLDEGDARPNLLWRAAAGAWHVPAGFAFLLRRPRLWPLAALPSLATLFLVAGGGLLGLVVAQRADPQLVPGPGQVPEPFGFVMAGLFWVAAVGAGAFLGLGLALLAAAPLLELLSRRVEASARGLAADASPGLVFEVKQSLRGALYFLLAAPIVFALGFVPLVGPLLSLLFGARAVALQMTDPALTRRGLSFSAKRRWHRHWLAESQGFGMAGMVGLIVPLANLLLGPALVTGGTLLVIELEELAGSAPRDAETRAGPDPVTATG
jgi:uncharacterized protein involved in cysteine biosynthesis